MKRRDFVRKSIGAGLAAGAAFSMIGYSRIFGKSYAPFDIPFDLVAIKGGEPQDMFDMGIQSLGGMKKFVKPGQKVVVKPNIGWDTTPERAADTNPNLVKRIIEHCFDAGAKEVLVFDNTCDNWAKCYENSGIEKAVNDAGGKIVPGNAEKYYQHVEVSDGKNLKETKVHELILDSDIFINVPILKSHGSSKLTISMKNLMGIVWDRRYWHRNNLNQCIADYATYQKKPVLNVVDAYRVMMRNGPRGVSVDDVVLMKSQIISTDMVAADAAAAKLFGMEPDDIDYITIADKMGVGTMDLSKLKIDRIKM